MAFCTAADVETFALIDFHSDLESHLTNNLIPVVEDAIREYVGYTVDYGTYTETFSGNQTKEYFCGGCYIKKKLNYEHRTRPRNKWVSRQR